MSAVRGWATVAIALLAGCASSGCGAAQDTGYAAANADCVTMSKSTAQAELCVSRLQVIYCGDGGLNAPMCTPADGGSDVRAQ